MTRWLDRLALAGMAVGMALILQPFGGNTFRTGFFVTFGSTLLHIVTSHLPRPAGR